MLKLSFCKMSSPLHPLAAWHSCSGAGVKSNTVLPFRIPRAAVEWRGGRGTGMLAAAGGKQAD